MTGILPAVLAAADVVIRPLLPMFPVLVMAALIGLAAKPIIQRLPVSDALKGPMIRLFNWAYMILLGFLAVVAIFAFSSIYQAGIEMNRLLEQEATQAPAQ